MRPPLDLRLPKSRRRLPLALAISFGVHIILVLSGAIDAWVPQLPRFPHVSPVTPSDTVPLFFETPRRPPGALPPRHEVPRRVARERPQQPFVAVPSEVPPEPAPLAGDTAKGLPVQEPPVAIGRIGPELAAGRLWVRPLPLPPKELARRLTNSHVELVDSAVTVVVQSYLDSIANDPNARAGAMPEWTTRMAGKKFGLDSSSVYIAGLKIPAAVLALLPIPAGNIDQNQAYNHLMELRADIFRAAQRAENLAEFKERIRAIRLRKEQEEEMKRNRRVRPEGAQDSTPNVVRQGE